jgi:hypothetical protein
MRKTLRPLYFVLPSLLGLLHAWLCFESFGPDPNGWGGFLAFLVDFPISILFAKLSNALSSNGLIIFLIGGTVWWFCLGLLISLVIGWFCRLVVKLSKQPLPPD